jgi:hypothetical protein
MDAGELATVRPSLATSNSAPGPVQISAKLDWDEKISRSESYSELISQAKSAALKGKWKSGLEYILRTWILPTAD